jgi:hypothetical protein
MTQREKDKLDVFINEVIHWREEAEKRFAIGSAKMDKIVGHLVDDSDSTNKGLLTRTNEIEEVMAGLKLFIDQEKRKRTIQERIFGGVLASIITSVIVYFFKK